MQGEQAEDQPEQLKDRSGAADPASTAEGDALTNVLAPGVAIVRDSTPRPFAFQPVEEGQTRGVPQPVPEAAAFPVQAPAAPPLPEEDYQAGAEDALRPPEATPLPAQAQASAEEFSEFIWLFEYGLAMDEALLNGAERLQGLALLYGPAVLRGYEITFNALNPGAVVAEAAIATIVPSRALGAEVWGVLYRIPRQLVEPAAGDTSRLDIVHDATAPQGLFERISVVVYEVQRERDIACLTYIATAAARRLIHLPPFERQVAASAYVRRLIEVAQKQKLPAAYLQRLVALTPLPAIEQSPPPAVQEQDTEPLLPVVRAPKSSHLIPTTPLGGKTPPTFSDRGMITFAVYIAISLLLVFALAIVHALGDGANLFPPDFTPLGIPWFVALFGHIGACLSCSVRLGRQHRTYPPTHVVLIWFTRPFVGVILAAVGYLLLNSGLFVPGGSAGQQQTISSLVAVLAGFCEGWLFYRRG